MGKRLMIAVRHQYDPAVPALEQFLTGMGRRKFTQPLYEALMAEGDWGRPLARRISVSYTHLPSPRDA